MSVSSLIPVPSKPTSQVCLDSYWILKAAHETSSDLLALFDKPQGGTRPAGKPGNTDQDLLRSMLIFAGAGLDASMKRLIEDAFFLVVESDEGVRKKAIEHFSKQLSNETKDLARWLFDEKPRGAMVSDLIKHLTGSSLQSKEQVETVIDYFKLERKNILAGNESVIKEAFAVRNKIIHEMDADLSKERTQGQRKRTQRLRTDMVNYANAIFRVASGFLTEVEKKIPNR